jgi:hypothetical protein
MMIGLTEQERQEALPFWAGLVSFVALFYLTGSFWKAMAVGIFVLGSCLLGLGQRWLFRGSFAIAILAIAVAHWAPQAQINGRSCCRTRDRRSSLKCPR